MWRCWKAGQKLPEIWYAFGKEHSSIRCLVSRWEIVFCRLNRQRKWNRVFPIRLALRVHCNSKAVAFAGRTRKPESA